MKNSQKVAAFGLAVAMGLGLFAGLFAAVPVASAQTTSAVQAQINQLMQEIDTLKASLGTSSGGSSYDFTRNLTVGSTGADVGALQQILITGGYLTAVTAPTDYFGALTKAALAAWQAANGVSPAVGFFGPITRAALAQSGVSTPSSPSSPSAPATGSASVSLAANTPAAGSVAKGAIVDFTNFTFNGGSTGVTVTTLVVNRLGLSSDSDVQNLYLDDSNGNLLAAGSFNNGVVTFTGSPLFTVAAGSSETVSVVASMSTTAQGGSTGDSIGYGILAASDVNVGSGTIAGTFPIDGNLDTIAAVSNLGGLTITSPNTLSTTINPGSLAANVGYFQFQGSNQPLSISYIKFTNVGSVSATNLQNFKLMYNGTTQVGATEQQVGDTVTFNLASDPMVIPSGNTVNLYLVADVLSGSTRTFQFTIQRNSDVHVEDTTYNTGITPGLATPTGQSPVPTGTTNQVTINAGSATMSVDTNSPTGAVAVGAQGQTLGVFDFTGSGEPIEVSSVTVTTVAASMGGGTGGSSSDYFKNGKLEDVTNATETNGVWTGGVQIGSVTNLNVNTSNGTVTTVFNIPGYWTIPAGTTLKLAVVSDLVANSANSAQLSDGGTGTLYVQLGTIVAQGENSLQTVSFGTGTGRTLTLTAGALVVSQNASLIAGTSNSPTGVAGQTGVEIGSFNLTAGSAEGVNITQISATLDATSSAQFQNVKATINGTQVGQSYGSVTNAEVLTFNPTSQLYIAAGSSVTVNIYADIQSGIASNLAYTNPVEISAVTATGATDNQSLTATGLPASGQTAYVSTHGTLTVAADPTAPTASQLQELVAGTTGQTLAVFNLAASPAENLNVTSVRVDDTEASTNVGIGDFQNLQLYVNGTAVCNGLTVPSLTASTATDGYATFNLQSCPIVVPAGDNISMTVKANVTQFPNAVPGAEHNFHLASGMVTSLGAVSGQGGGTSAAVTGVNAFVYRTSLTAAEDSSSPSGLTSANATQTVAVLDLTNASNGSNAQATVLPTTILGSAVTSTLSFTINSTLPINASTTRQFSVYKSSDLVDPVIQGTINTEFGATGTWNGTLTFKMGFGSVASATFTPSGSNSIGSAGSVSGVTIVPQVINAGQTQTYTIRFDTSDRSATGQTFTLSIPTQGSNLVWTDTNTSVSSVNGLPITFGTLQY